MDSVLENGYARCDMGGGGGSEESKTEIAPEFKPYITYSLGEAQRLYQNLPQAPETLTPEQSAFSQAAIQQAAQRAQAGSPLVGAAQAEQLATIQGRGVNPFLAGALEQSNRLAREQFTEGVQGLQSKASSMGRYGSSALAEQEGRAQDVFARAMAEQGGQLAYQSAEAERARQMQAAQAAPGMAQADYADIQRLLQAGQAQEGYAQQALQGRLAAQDLPMQRLQQAANVFYGAPLETKSTTTTEGGK
jgi:hypothetical protein